MWPDQTLVEEIDVSKALELESDLHHGAKGHGGLAGSCAKDILLLFLWEKPWGKDMVEMRLLYPQSSSILDGIFPYKPSILMYFGGTPVETTINLASESFQTTMARANASGNRLPCWSHYLGSCVWSSQHRWLVGLRGCSGGMAPRLLGRIRAFVCAWKVSMVRLTGSTMC